MFPSTSPSRIHGPTTCSHLGLFPEVLDGKPSTALSQTEYKNINPCWIDTLSIDQADYEDKQRQIPLIGLIYGNAVVVAIVTKETFGL
jgi:Heterokaryon incompatibility protein (HET)